LIQPARALEGSRESQRSIQRSNHSTPASVLGASAVLRLELWPDFPRALQRFRAASHEAIPITLERGSEKSFVWLAQRLDPIARPQTKFEVEAA